MSPSSHRRCSAGGRNSRTIERYRSAAQMEIPVSKGVCRSNRNRSAIWPLDAWTNPTGRVFQRQKRAKAAIKTSGLENAGTRYCARASRCGLQARKFLDPIKRSTWFGRTLSGVMSVQTWRRFGYCVRKTNSSETAQPISSANTTHLPNRGCALGNPSM
jgi:hypothetical protein